MRQNTQLTQNNTTQKVALVSSTTDALKETEAKRQDRQSLV